MAVEVTTADHQNKVDIGTTIARRWLEREGVDMIIDVPNSAIALGVNTLARDLNKVFIASGAGTADLTGKACSPNTVHWTYDTWELGHSIVVIDVVFRPLALDRHAADVQPPVDHLNPLAGQPDHPLD